AGRPGAAARRRAARERRGGRAAARPGTAPRGSGGARLQRGGAASARALRRGGGAAPAFDPRALRRRGVARGARRRPGARRADPRGRADRAGDGRRRDHDRGGRDARQRATHRRRAAAGGGAGRRRGARRGRAAAAGAARRRPRPRREPDGRHVLPVARARLGRLRRGGRPGRARADPVHPRGDETDERGQGRDRGGRAADPRRERGARRVRAAAVRARAGRRTADPLMFSRVLVANRGEIAVRVIRALHELGIEAVAIYSTADKDALHVRIADHAVCVGPATASESYLRIPNVVAAAETTGCEAVHPGYGFLAENPAFVEACVENELVFVGPPADVMATMGDKISAKRAMRVADVPTVPGTEGATTIADVRDAADEVGYPVLLKASAGGGGKGMRLVRAPEELKDAFGMAAAEAEAAFGDPTMYVEKAVVPARHVEIQVLCDLHGNVLTLGERECSIQRRHQKLVEESPSAALTPELREAMEAAAERACRAVGYRNAGTFEFLLGPDGSFYFIELNARLQVEHPVTELCTGIDLVREQLRVAAGEELAVTGRAPRRGHAIEIRLNAEDPEHDFRPSPGLVARFEPPLGPGVRVDTFIESGTTISPFYDSMVAKLIGWDADRGAAIARAERALRETVVEGVPTTRELALAVLASDAFRSGDYSTSTLEAMRAVVA